MHAETLGNSCEKWPVGYLTGAVGEVWSYQQLAHSQARVFFKCHLFRKSVMDQRLIQSALTSAALQHASPTGDPGTFTGSFDSIPAHSQVLSLALCSGAVRMLR